MSVVYKFVGLPTISDAPIEIIKQFMGLEVPINQLEVVGVLGQEQSKLGKFPDYRFNSRYVVMTKDALVMAAFSQKKYQLGHFLNRSAVVADVFKVERALVTEV